MCVSVYVYVFIYVCICLYIYMPKFIWYTKVISYHTKLSFLGNVNSDPVRDTNTRDL